MPQGVGSGFDTCKHNLLLSSHLGDMPIDQKSASVVMVRKVGGNLPHMDAGERDAASVSGLTGYGTMV